MACQPRDDDVRVPRRLASYMRSRPHAPLTHEKGRHAHDESRPKPSHGGQTSGIKSEAV